MAARRDNSLASRRLRKWTQANPRTARARRTMPAGMMMRKGRPGVTGALIHLSKMAVVFFFAQAGKGPVEMRDEVGAGEADGVAQVEAEGGEASDGEVGQAVLADEMGADREAPGGGVGLTVGDVP